MADALLTGSADDAATDYRQYRQDAEDSSLYEELMQGPADTDAQAVPADQNTRLVAGAHNAAQPGAGGGAVSGGADTAGASGAADKTDFAGLIGSGLLSLARGVVDIPGDIALGMAGAVDKTSELIGDTADELYSAIPDSMKGGALDLLSVANESRAERGLAPLTPGDLAFGRYVEMPNRGGLVQPAAQFLTGFLVGGSKIRAMKLFQGGKLAALSGELTAGMVADAVVFDPHEARLATFLNEVPALAPLVPDYLADNDPSHESAWEGRLKNAIEGAGLGLLSEALLRGFKYYKAQRQGRTAMGAGPETPAETVANTAIADNAAQDIVDPLTDRDILRLGDPQGGFVVRGEVADTTAGDAAVRVAEAADRADMKGALDRIRAIDAGQAGAPVDSFDEALDVLRGGGPKIAEDRLVQFLIRKGGVRNEGGEIMSLLGGSARVRPGLINNRSGMTLDQAVEAAQEANYIGRGVGLGQQMGLDVEAATRNDLFDAMRRDLGQGDAVYPQTAGDQVANKQFYDELATELDKLGIDPTRMSNSEVRQALDDIEREKLANIGPEPGQGRPITEAEAAGELGNASASPGAQRSATEGPEQFVNETLADIDMAIEAAKRREIDDIAQALGGEEQAREFLKLDRQRNSSMPDIRDPASARMAEIERNLTPEQEHLIYGAPGDQRMGVDELQIVRSALQDLEFLPDYAPLDVAEVFTHGMQDVDAGGIAALRAGTADAETQAGFLRMRGAWEELKRRGLEQTEIETLLQQALVARGVRDPADVQYLIDDAISAFTSTREAKAARSVKALGAPGAYTRDELERMPVDELDRMAYGRAGGDIETLAPSQIEIVRDDIENAEYAFERGGMAWAESVDLSEPVTAIVRQDGSLALKDGHHRWLAARETGRNLRVEFEVEGKPIEEILRRQDAQRVPVPTPADARQSPQKIFVNLSKINSSEDIRAVIQEMADLDADAINAKRGGQVQAVEDMVRKSANEYTALEDLIGRKPGPMTAAQALGARRVLASSAEQLVELARRANRPDATKADMFAFQRAQAVHYAIQSEVIAARTETARALRSWAVPVGPSKSRGEAVAEMINRMGGANDLRKMARAIVDVAENPAAINAVVDQGMRGKLGKALYQVWINGLLSSPKTHLVNILSNSAVSVWAIPERYLQAGISQAFGNGEVGFGEARALAYGWAKGTRDAVKLVAMGKKAANLEDVADLFDQFGKIEGRGDAISAKAFGADPAGAFGYGIDFLGRAINLPGTLLESEDKFFKAIGYRMELNARAARMALDEGLDGQAFAERVADILRDPPEDLVATALDVAHYQTFTKPLGQTGQAFQNFVNRVPGARLVVPFIRTPTNIMKYTFERTPLALMAKSVRADIRAGGPRAAQAWARMTAGSMLMLTIADLSADGIITGHGPADPKMQAALRRTGWQPYSVKIGDRYYQYSRLDPLGMLIGMSADISEIVGQAEIEDGGKLVTAGLFAFAQNLSSKTYLRGVFDLIAALDPSNPSSDPGKYVANFAGSAIPFSALLRNIAQADDTSLRDARAVASDETTSGLKPLPQPLAEFVGEMVNNMRRGIPGLSETLPARRDLWGQAIDRASGLGWAFDLLSPVYSSADKPDMVDREIIDNRIAVSMPSRVIQGVRLTADEYARYVELAGRPAKEALDQIVGSPGFATMSGGPDGLKASIINDTVLSFRDAARARMVAENSELRQRINERQMQAIEAMRGSGR